MIRPKLAAGLSSRLRRIKGVKFVLKARPRPPVREDRRGSPPTAAQLGRAALRRENAGRWVAWAPDLSRIVVVADTPEEVRATGQATGIPGLIYERVPPASSR